MAASLMNMLDDLETRLERTQAELLALREENQRLKQQLAQKDAQAQSVPSSEPAATIKADTSSEVAFGTQPLEASSLETSSLEAPSLEAPSLEAQPLNTQALDVPVPEKSASDETVPFEAVSVEAASVEADPVEATPAETAKAPSPHALLNQWYERYPKAFFKGHTKPLKIGIHQELAEREEWPNKLIRRALANYVNLPRYIKAVREGAERVDLDGQSAGKVDKEAALHASQKRGDQKVVGQPKKAQSNSSPAAKKPRIVAPKQHEVEHEVKKAEPRKPLSMEDKLLDLQQKFKGR
ncbi:MULTISPECIES: ProQ/FINO family protein [unclassified Halomonas]|uniref:ProQ/FINO family protein n=1 Tax=unclassified Halomonas TaxID=2609666 RepID=UPI0007DA429D|nr:MULTISPECIES: ProQ/FINO family protein [unclassified Halomonas]MBT2787296.1 ABC transporter substrate-binding protein [Halomonas sp. ISL-106]MBT2796340.1 ABC transporter substrate-binding protein [Halomonas sp. ISL-104]OAL57511.1 ABC transporter substrate-binding protein [Halomonas sp. ALS9]